MAMVVRRHRGREGTVGSGMREVMVWIFQDKVGTVVSGVFAGSYVAYTGPGSRFFPAWGGPGFPSADRWESLS
jgi:hypothetical protein